MEIQVEIQEQLIFNFKGAKTSYLTHSLHPYPAKFPPQLPKMILAQFGKKGQTVLDPFCGSGTTLVEANLHCLNAIGVDVNGLCTDTKTNFYLAKAYTIRNF